MESKFKIHRMSIRGPGRMMNSMVGVNILGKIRKKNKKDLGRLIKG